MNRGQQMASGEERDRLIARHVEELNREFHNLRLARDARGHSVVIGTVGFVVPWEDMEIEDDYDIEIIIPHDYPNSPPTVCEIGGKIPRDDDWHVNAHDGMFCLSAPHAVKRRFARQRNLLRFVKEQVVPFLFWVSYKRKTGREPFAHLSHGAQGLLEYYKKLFSTQDNGAVLRLLMLLAHLTHSEDGPCPCQSGFKFKRCHQKVVKKARKHHSPEEFLAEYRAIYDHLYGVSEHTRTHAATS